MTYHSDQLTQRWSAQDESRGRNLCEAVTAAAADGDAPIHFFGGDSPSPAKTIMEQLQELSGNEIV